MAKHIHSIILSCLLVCMVASCSIHIEKRHYRKGFFIKKSTLISSNKLVSDQIDIDLVANDSIKEDNSLAEVDVTSNQSDTYPTHPFDIDNNLDTTKENTHRSFQSKEYELETPKTERSNSRILQSLNQNRFLQVKNISRLITHNKNTDEEDIDGVLIAIAIVLLIILALIVFVFFAVTLSYGGLNWISFAFGLGLLLILILIVFLSLRLIS